MIDFKKNFENSTIFGVPLTSGACLALVKSVTHTPRFIPVEDQLTRSGYNTV